MGMNLPAINFVAEVSANHLGSLQRAKEIVEAAAEAGATSVKFQTYTADTMTLNIDNEEFAVKRDHSLWGGRNLYSLYKEAHTPWEWHFELFELCRSLGVIPFSSPFDLSAVDFLESLNAPMYKIASLETSDLKLIKAVAQTKKPLIISTGATMWSEIEDLVEVVQQTKNKDLTLLVCTSSYPAKPIDAHLRRIQTLKEGFGAKVGISDHTLGIGVSLAAIALGATVVEKHLTLSRLDGGADGQFSLEPNEFAMLVKEGTAAHQALGDSAWKMQEAEKESRRLRRSLYIVKDVEAGDLVSLENVKALRPGDGCAPKKLEDLIGKEFLSAQKRGTPMSESLVKQK